MSDQPRMPAGSPNGEGGRYTFKPGADGSDISMFKQATPSDRWANAADDLRRILNRNHEGAPVEPTDRQIAAHLRSDEELATLLADRRATISQRQEYYRRQTERDPHWLDMKGLMNASQPGDSYDYRNVPVCRPEVEMEYIARMVGTADHLGPVGEQFLPWTATRQEAADAAENAVWDALFRLRQAVAVDPTRCYSERLVKRSVARYVHVSKYLHDRFGMSEHEMRVGMRYYHALQQYALNHEGAMPDAGERDRIWDDTTLDYLNEKIAAGKSYGGGYRLSDGRNANPLSVEARKAAEAVERGERFEWHVARLPDGSPLNARIRFEDRVASIKHRLQHDSVEERRESVGRELSDTPSRMSEYASATGVEESGSRIRLSASNERELSEKFHEYYEAGGDLTYAAQRFDIPLSVVEQWAASW